jgi:hypothetical protein
LAVGIRFHNTARYGPIHPDYSIFVLSPFEEMLCSVGLD